MVTKRFLQESDLEMVTVMLDTEVCSGPVTMSKTDALRCKKLLTDAFYNSKDFPKEVNEIIDRNKSIPIFGRISTTGEGLGWSDGV